MSIEATVSDWWRRMRHLRSRPCEDGAIDAARHLPGLVQSRNWVLVAAVLASTISYIDESVVNVALPAIEADLHASVAVMQWLINAYTLSLAALVLLGGAAGDRFGRRRVFIAGVAVFAASSLWCGLAGNVGQLIAARAVQGMGAALLIPCALALIGAAFDDSSRGKAIGTWAGCSAVAAAIGPLLGGWIVDHTSWRWIFLINPVLALPTILIVLRHVQESSDPQAKPGIDWLGAALAFAGLGALVFGLIALSDKNWNGLLPAAAMALGALLLTAFIWVERHSANPMMPLELFRSSTFSGVNLLTLFLYGALAGAFFFLPFALIQVHGYSATAAGAVFLPFTVIMGVLSRWAGGLLDRFGARLPLVIGPIIVALGFALLALLADQGSYFIAFVVPVVVLAMGMTVAVAPLTTTVISAVPTHRSGVASGVNNAVASLAALLAVAGFGALALFLFDAVLDRHMTDVVLAAGGKAELATVRGNFAATGLSAEAQAIVRAALSRSIRIVMVLAAAMALAGALCSAALIRSGHKKKGQSDRPGPR
jgi:EmrB/QacA subfamily drug resistance transporter